MANEQRFSISVDINTPPDRVFEVMADTDRWHEWTPSVTSIKRLDAGDFKVGTRAVIRQPKFPPALWTITAIDSNSFTWENHAPGIRVIAQHSAEPIPSGARATLSLRYEGFLAKLLARVTPGITHRYLWLEASGLKARSENPFFTFKKQTPKRNA
jgi:uncharacterized protein YndB with AHSA1/START domain